MFPYTGNVVLILKKTAFKNIKNHQYNTEIQKYKFKISFPFFSFHIQLVRAILLKLRVHNNLFGDKYKFSTFVAG